MKTDKVIKDLRAQLVPYLKSKGIDVTAGNIECINKENHAKGKDNNPSMGLIPNSDVTHCFTCGAVADIFHWANKLDGLPIGANPQFYTITLPKLSKSLLGQTYLPDVLSIDDRKMYLIRSAYNSAVEYFQPGTDITNNYIKERGWDDSVKVRYKLGGISSFNEYLSYMANSGFPDIEFLRAIGLYNPELFNERRLLIPIYDEFGNIIRISGRIINGEGVKYINTKSNELNISMPKLYGLKHIRGKEHVYLVEGFSDVITLFHYGYDNAIGIMGCSLNVEQLQYIRKLGIHNVTLMFDGDPAGYKGMVNNLDSLLKEVYINMSIGVLPDGKDPDEYLKEHKSFSGIEVHTPLQLLLKSEDSEAVITENKIDKYVDLIAATPNEIARNRMINELSKISDISDRQIRASVNEKRQLTLNAKLREDYHIKRDILKMARSSDVSVDDIEHYLERQKTNRIKELVADPITMSIDILDSAKNIIDTRIDEPAMHLGCLKQLEHDVEGFALEGNLLFITGLPHAGKSSWLRFLLAQIAISNDDIMTVYFSMEDGKEKAYPSFMSIINGYLINVNKNKERMYSFGENAKLAYDAAWNKIRELNRDRKLLVYDRTIGNNLSIVETYVKLLQDENPDRKIVVGIDSLNAMSEDAFSGSPNEEMIYKLNKLRDISSICDIPIFNIIELRKMNGKKIRDMSYDDAAYTKRIGHAADFLVALGADSEDLMDAPTYPYQDKITGEIEPQPIISLYVKKNKINGVTGTYQNCFIKDRCIFEELDREEAKSYTRDSNE